MAPPTRHLHSGTSFGGKGKQASSALRSPQSLVYSPPPRGVPRGCLSCLGAGKPLLLLTIWPPPNSPPSHSLSLSPVSVFETMSTHYPHCGYMGKGIKGNITGEMLVSVSKISCSKDLQTCFPCSYLPEQSFGPNGGGIIPLPPPSGEAH